MFAAGVYLSEAPSEREVNKREVRGAIVHKAAWVENNNMTDCISSL
jgi:hypothetical protein